MEKLIYEITELAEKSLSTDRFEHSVRVAETAAFMCGLYGISKEKGYLAGISHDICKEIPKSQMIEFAKKDGFPIEDFESEKPGLLHGRAAAVFLREKFGIDDKDVLESIAFHTFGKTGLCDLGKIIFIADKIEPGRPQSTDEYRTHLFAMPLDEITYLVVKENCDYLVSHDKIPAPISIDFLKELSEKTGRKNK